METRDKLKATGTLRITALRVNRLLSREELALAILRGLAFPILKTDNLLVDIGLEAITALIGGGRGSPTVGGGSIDEATVRDLAVVQMLVTAKADPPPVDPTTGDTALEGSTEWDFHVQNGVGDSLLAVVYPTVGELRFSGLIPKSEKDGVTFTEEGLFANNGKLIARTTFSKLKTTAFALQLDHSLTIVRA